MYLTAGLKVTFFIKMKELKISRKWLITWGIIILFVILNPSKREFGEHLGFSKERTQGYAKRTVYLLICSIYFDDYNDDYYLGIFKNFIPIKTR